MKFKILLFLFAALVVASISSSSYAQVKTVGDTTWITGGTFAGGENAGVIDSAIDADTVSATVRSDPNRVYALYEGQVYYQLTPIYVYDPTGTLTIVGVPDPKNPTATEKPIILIQPTGSTPVSMNAGATVNEVYGSLKLVNIHYQTQEMDGTQTNELFMCGTANQLAQKLTVDNCLFEFSNIDLFDCTNESGAIGGWPYGASFFITNSYFRNMNYPGQWWGSRVFQCKHPTDTCWVENCTVTTGGLTFLQQNELTDFTFINHNTIINNKKYWLLSPYKHNEFITNNIFVNQDWVGEDSAVTQSGQDPDKLYMSTINIDTNNSTNGLVVQPKYMIGGDTANIDQSQLGFTHMRIFISNNMNFYDPLLVNGYYKNSAYMLPNSAFPDPWTSASGIPSYLGWEAVDTPQVIGNMPGEWMNSRTAALFKAYAPPNGGFVEQNTDSTETTPPFSYGLTSNVVTAMAQWNQNANSDPRFKNPSPAIDSTTYIYGDYDPTTLPGIISNQKTDKITQATTIGSGDQIGISKFTDLTENFSQSSHISSIDGLPLGSLMWNDAQNAAYVAGEATDAHWAAVKAAYNSVPGLPSDLLGVKTTTEPKTFALSQNYPNPFNPSTEIDYTLPQGFNGFVTLKVYNVLGQEVSTLFAGSRTAGTFTVKFDASRFASGVYFYRMDAGSFSSTKKMVLMK